jgi:rifampicin phosphotransferase
MTAKSPTDFPIPQDLPPGFWNWDRVHCPHPTSPLEQEMMLDTTAAGFSRSMAELGSTFGVTSRLINYYSYLTFVPLDLGDEDREARRARYQQNVAELMPRVRELWETEWLPAMLPSLERGRNTDYATFGDDELLRTFLQMKEEVVDRWAVHGKINYSFHAAGIFADYYREVIQPDNENEGYEALQGFPSIALENSRAIWQLSRMARENLEVRRIFDSAESGELQAELLASEEARDFGRSFEAYLDEYGWRSDSVYEMRKPSWREDPGIALAAVQSYIKIGDEGGPDAQYSQAVERREKLLAEARRKLASEPEKLQRFEELYKQAEPFTPISEDHNHFIDQMGDIIMRYPARELGRRLAARGVIEEAEDVFYLYTTEISEGMSGRTDFKAPVAERKADMERFAQVVPPPAIGTPPPGPSGDPMEDVLIRFFGTPVEPSADALVIKGVAASPGTVRGPAKVVRDLSEAGKLSKGDILVCEMTLPPWTPLFSIAAGVVTESGGILSHSAIVAREYRIPCVVGTAVCTRVIKDGMMLTVDGSKGMVRIEST